VINSAAPEAVVKASLSRLLIVRLGSMGDVIHTLPAVSALGRNFPEATLGWIIEERWAELLCTLPTPRCGARSAQRPLVDRIHTVNTGKWRRAPLSIETLEQLAAGLSELRAPRYQIAVDFQGAIRSSLLAKWSGAPTIYGFRQPRENVAAMFYTHPIIAEGRHIVEQNLSLAQAITRNFSLNFDKDDQLYDGPSTKQLPHDPAAEIECEQRLQQLQVKQFVVLNPGAGWGAKQWPADRFAQVARELSQGGLPSLINYGPGEEPLAKLVESESGGAAKRIQCSVTQLVALLRRATLFIGGDTGPMHLASALRVPVVALFGPTDPGRNGPFGSRSVLLRSASSQTKYTHRAQTDQGLLEITPAEVIAAARLLLEGK